MVVILEENGALLKDFFQLEVPSAHYPSHMCHEVGTPPQMEMPPDHHRPTPRPAASIFHEMMVNSYDQSVTNIVYLSASGGQRHQQPGDALDPPVDEGCQTDYGAGQLHQPFPMGELSRKTFHGVYELIYDFNYDIYKGSINILLMCY